MKTVRIKFYKPRLDGHFLDDGIALWTSLWNPSIIRWPFLYCSHAGVWRPTTDGKFEIDGKICGDCTTSTMRGKENGVVIRPAIGVLKNRGRWFYAEFECEDDDYMAANSWLYQQVDNNQGYGKRTIASFFWFRRKAKVIVVNGVKVIQYICSGFTDNYLDYALEKTPWDIPSPIRLAIWMYENRHRLKIRFYDLKTGKAL